MMNWTLFLVVFFATIFTADARVSRYDEYQGGTFTGTTGAFTTSVDAGNVKASGNTVTSTNTNGDLILDANGTGVVRVNSPFAVSDDGLGDVTHTISGASVESTLEVHQTAGTEPGGLSIHRHIDSADFGAHFLGLKSRGSHVSPTVVQLNDALARFVATGYDGTDYEISSEIRMYVDGTPADDATDMPGRIGFYVSPDGSSTPAEAVRISEDKSMGVSDGTASVPGINFLSDENTGIYRSTADTFGLVAGGYLGMQIKKSTGNYTNLGFGGSNASVSDAYPILVERTTAQPLNVQISNPSSDAAASSRFQLKANAGTMTGEIGVWAGSSVDAYNNYLAVRSTDSSTGVSFIADNAAGVHKFYNAGVAATDESFRIYADHSWGFMREIATPSNPASNSYKVYAKSDGNIYKLNSSGVESTLGGGDTHLKNYFSDYEADAISNVAEYDDGGTTSPVDGTGGSPSVTSSLITGAPISGDASYQLEKPASDVQGQGWSIDFDTLDKIEKDGTKTVHIGFCYESPGAYTSGMYNVWVYRVGSNTLEALNTFQGSDFTNDLPAAGSGDTACYTGWTTANSSDTNLRLIIHVATTDATAINVKVDRVEALVHPKVQTFIGSDWESYTPTWTNLTVGNATQTFKWRRVGDSMEISGHFLWGSTTSGSGTFEFSLPSGYSVDNTKARSTYARFGTAWLQDSGAGVREVYRIVQNATNARFYASGQTNAGTSGDVNTTFPFTWATNDEFDVLLTVPIEGWTSGNAMSTAELSVRSVKAVYALSSGTANSSFADITSEVIDFDTELIDTHNAVTTGASWRFDPPVSGKYRVSAKFLWANATNLGINLIRLRTNGVEGIELCRNNGTNDTSLECPGFDIDLGTDDYIDLIAYQDDTTGAARSVETADANRTWITVERIADLDAVGVQGVNEQKTVGALNNTAFPGAAGVMANVATLELPPGTWEMSGFINGRNTTGSTAVDCYGAISKYSGTTTTDHVDGENQTLLTINTQYQTGTIIIQRYVVTLTETTTMYLKASVSSTGTVPSIQTYRMSARRIQ